MYLQSTLNPSREIVTAWFCVPEENPGAHKIDNAVFLIETWKQEYPKKDGLRMSRRGREAQQQVDGEPM